MTLSIQAIAGRARRSCQTGKKLTARFLRASLGREPLAEEFTAMRTEVERQDAIRLARSQQRGTYFASTPDVLEMLAKLAANFGPRFQREAEYRAAKRIREAAQAAVRAGARDKATMEAAGLAHLVGRRREQSNRGSWGYVVGKKVFAMNEFECEILGLACGPANY